MTISNGTWQVISELGPTQNIADTSTTKNHEIGKRVRARDVGTTAYGEAEFIYLKGVASTAVGSLVMYDHDGATTLTVARIKGPVAVAMSANVASGFGWYQIQGRAVVKCATVAANTIMYVTASAGVVDDAVVTGDIVYGARISTADDTGLCQANIMYPSCSDTDNA